MISIKSVVVAACNRTLVLAFAYFLLTNVLNPYEHVVAQSGISGKLYRQEFECKKVQYAEGLVANQTRSLFLLEHTRVPNNPHFATYQKDELITCHSGYVCSSLCCS